MVSGRPRSLLRSIFLFTVLRTCSFSSLFAIRVRLCHSLVSLHIYFRRYGLPYQNSYMHVHMFYSNGNAHDSQPVHVPRRPRPRPSAWVPEQVPRETSLGERPSADSAGGPRGWCSRRDVSQIKFDRTATGMRGRKAFVRSRVDSLPRRHAFATRNTVSARSPPPTPTRVDITFNIPPDGRHLGLITRPCIRTRTYVYEYTRTRSLCNAVHGKCLSELSRGLPPSTTSNPYCLNTSDSVTTWRIVGSPEFIFKCWVLSGWA